MAHALIKPTHPIEAAVRRYVEGVLLRVRFQACLSSLSLAVILRVLRRIDWESVFDVMYGLGSQLNHRSERHEKGSLSEVALATTSVGGLQRVNGIGSDFLVLATGARLESKFQCITTDYRCKNRCKGAGALKPTLQRILKNSLGSRGYPQLHPKGRSDWYLIWNQRGAWVVPFDTVQRHTVLSGRQLRLNLAVSKMHCVIQSSDDKRKRPWGSSEYLVRKRALQHDLIETAIQRRRTTREALNHGFAPRRRRRLRWLWHLFRCYK